MPRRRIPHAEPRPLRADRAYDRRCGRTAYATPADALIALGSIPEGRALRRCPACGRYHLVGHGETLHSRRGGGRK